MRDWGFTPERGKTSLAQIRHVLRASIDNGWQSPPVRAIMLAGCFAGGVGIYVFYAMQPYLLELYGDPQAYTVAGLTAAIVAAAQIVGGLTVTFIRRLFRTRTGLIISATAVSIAAVAGLGLVTHFATAIGLLVIWGFVFSMVMPVRQAYLNGLIPSAQRATVLSFDSLMGSSGGVVAQPLLGRVADASGYATSYLVAAAINLFELPFLLAARAKRASSDRIERETASTPIP